MGFSRLACFAVISTLIGSAVAEFKILAPGGSNIWWGEYPVTCLVSWLTHHYVIKVAQSQNSLVWSCNDDAPATAYTVL